MLNAKYIKPRKATEKCTMIVKGDWNDGDSIIEQNTWDIEVLNKYLPHFSIVLDLYNFDEYYRHKNHDYSIDIRFKFYEALGFYLDYKKGFYQELLDLKKDKKILSERLINLDEDRFKEIYGAVITEIREYLGDVCNGYLPYTYDGFGIHSIEEIYIDYKGDKYDILPDETLEALAELMDREYDNFS